MSSHDLDQRAWTARLGQLPARVGAGALEPPPLTDLASSPAASGALAEANVTGPVRPGGEGSAELKRESGPNYKLKAILRVASILLAVEFGRLSHAA